MSDRAQIVFHEEQPFRVKRQRLMLAIPPVAMLLLLVWQVILGHPWGKQPMSNGNVIGWTIFVWLVYWRLLTVRLVTNVRPGELRVAMRGLWPERRISLGDVKSTKIIAFDPARDYGGYGIRTTRSGKAYVATGTRGVKLELAKGGTVIVGSERPEELVSAIHNYVSNAASP